MTGPASNKLMFSSDDETVSTTQPESVRRIVGKHTIFELVGLKSKQMRLVYMGFLKADRVRACIKDMDRIVKLRLAKGFSDKGNEFSGKQFSDSNKEFSGDGKIYVVPAMKHITFDVAFKLIFGLPEGEVEEELFRDFTTVFKPILSVPVNFLATNFRRGLRARERIIKALVPMIREAKAKMGDELVRNKIDFITSLLRFKDEEGKGNN
ncbi:hypothetical protein AMTR_s00077p00080880 [Amborella trichopoda]|uniref:Uncharacterized protein n=1 Tax=Amborella trichopoda TaxID=13333 RepID=W1P982_AMBTC|nr:hypothetical protein AMTR_s00077p00080880 [Amborella trichopoda]